MTFRDLLTETRDTALGAFAHQRHQPRPGGARTQPRPPPRRRADDPGQLRLPRTRRRRLQPRRACTCERAELRGHLTQLPLGFMVEFDATGRGWSRPSTSPRSSTPTLAAAACSTTSRCCWTARWPTRTRPLSRLDVLSAPRTPNGCATCRHGERVRHTRARTLTAPGRGTGRPHPRRRRRGLRGPPLQLPRDQRGREPVGALADRPGHRHRGPRRGAAGQVTRTGHHRARHRSRPARCTCRSTRPTPRTGCRSSSPTRDPKVVLREPVTDLDGYSAPTIPTDADRVRPLRPENTAYLIYTSGSTGLPKGVPVPHRPIAEYFVWFGGDYQVDANDRLLQVASPSFDVSIGEIFGMLACGARLVIPRPAA